MTDKKIILVSGGSGLLGKAMIKDLKDKGAFPINLDLNVEDNLQAGTFRCDITSDESIIEMVKSVIKEFGRIDGLVNNAYPRTNDWGEPFESIKPDSWRKNVDMQLNSYFVICQEVLKHMKKVKKGSIVNIASIYGVVGNDFTVYENTDINPPAAYSAIKGGIINMTKYLASLYGQHNIRVNAVSPGGIFDHQPESFVASYERKVPMKRMGTPDDIAPSVSFLLSDESEYVTGHNLVVDGGWTAI